jgi:hypothetical protein
MCVARADLRPCRVCCLKPATSRVVAPASEGREAIPTRGLRGRPVVAARAPRDSGVCARNGPIVFDTRPTAWSKARHTTSRQRRSPRCWRHHLSARLPGRRRPNPVWTGPAGIHLVDQRPEHLAVAVQEARQRGVERLAGATHLRQRHSRSSPRRCAAELAGNRCATRADHPRGAGSGLCRRGNRPARPPSAPVPRGGSRPPPARRRCCALDRHHRRAAEPAAHTRPRMALPFASA